MLLVVGQFWSGIPRSLVRLMQWLERHPPAQLNWYYTLTLGYFYWLGAQAMIRANRRAGHGIMSLKRFTHPRPSLTPPLVASERPGLR